MAVMAAILDPEPANMQSPLHSTYSISYGNS